MTQIFDNYSAFLSRTDKTINGVSPSFAENNPTWEADNSTNDACWNCSGCSGCSGCSDCSRCSDCSDCSGCSRCSDCSDCSDCSGCSGCSGCSDCSDCSRCSDCSGLKNASPVENKAEENKPLYPIIPNIHQRILGAVSAPAALDMSTWHTCDTTHCRAGWVVTLAGEEGRALESKTSTLFAAMMIYNASSPINVSPTRFFESNDVALADMERCANEEKALTA